MQDLLTKPGFWAGVVMLLVYQGRKFTLLSSSEFGEQGEDTYGLHYLRTRDFVSPLAFYWAGVIYVLISGIFFMAACYLLPLLFVGGFDWAGITINSDLLNSPALPVVLAAAYMGIVGPRFTFIEPFERFQKNILNGALGVPRRVLNASSQIAYNIREIDEKGEFFKRVLDKLIDPTWINSFSNYFDSDFYRSELTKRGFDNEKISKETKEQIEHNVEVLVCLASLACVRKSGARVLKRLADDLGVPFNPPPLSSSGLAPGVLIALATVVILCFIVPMPATWTQADGLSGSGLWPETPGSAGSFLVAQMVPIFFAILLTLYLRPSQKLKDDNVQGVASNVLLQHYNPLFAVFIFVLAFDHLQMFYDNAVADSGSNFHAQWLPYHSLHALISVVACFTVLCYGVKTVNKNSAYNYKLFSVMLFIVILLSAVYAISRLQNHFNSSINIVTYDYLLLIVMLNVIATAEGVVVAAIYYRSTVQSSNIEFSVGFRTKFAP